MQSELKTPFYVVEPCKFGNRDAWQAGTALVYFTRAEAQEVADASNARLAQNYADALKPRHKLEIEDRGNGVYEAYLTDVDGNLYSTGPVHAHPYAAADWCERNGFAWEVIGADDPVARLAEWRAAQ